MLARGAPPMPTRFAKADISMMSGKQTPSPVSATAPGLGDVADVHAVDDVVERVDELRRYRRSGEPEKQRADGVLSEVDLFRKIFHKSASYCARGGSGAPSSSFLSLFISRSSKSHVNAAAQTNESGWKSQTQLIETVAARNHAIGRRKGDAAADLHEEAVDGAADRDEERVVNHSVHREGGIPPS